MAVASRIKFGIILAIILLSALALLASTQTWYTLQLSAAANHPGSLDVSGSKAAPALTALALAGIALAGALAISGAIARIVVGALGFVLGGCITLSAVLAIAQPAATGISAVTDATGIGGSTAVIKLITRADSSVWPIVALIVGVLIALAGIAILATIRRWPESSRRYQSAHFEPADGQQQEHSAERPKAENSRDAAIDSWDELSKGDDPTE